MRTRGYVILCSLLLSLGAAPTLTQAGWGGEGPGRHHGGPGGPGMHMMGGPPGMAFHMILRKLNLNAEQQSALESKLAPHKATLKSLFQQIRTARKALEEKIFSDTPPTDDDSDAKKLRDALNAAQKEGLATALEIRSFLVDQNLWPQAVQVWKQMETMREQMHNFFEEQE